MAEVTASPFFGIAISILAFAIGIWVQKKTGLIICNPLIIAIVLVSGVLLIFKIPYEHYNEGGSIINMFLAPATAWLPESEGNMLHLGSFASFVGGLQAAAGAAEGEHKAAIVLTVSVLFSCAVGVLLTLTGGLVTLPLAGIVLYQAAWCVLALVFPLMQHYY